MSSTTSVEDSARRTRNTKWQPKQIYLEPVKILREEKEKRMFEITQLLLKMQESFLMEKEKYDQS